MRKTTEDKLNDMPDYGSGIPEELKDKWVEWGYRAMDKNVDVVQLAVEEETGGTFSELGLGKEEVTRLALAAKAGFMIGFLAALRGAFDPGNPDAEKIIRGEMEE